MYKIIFWIFIFFFWISNIFWYTQDEINNIMWSYYDSISEKSHFYKQNRIKHLLSRIKIIETKIQTDSSNYQTLLSIKKSLDEYKFDLNDFNTSNYYDYKYSNIILTFDNSFEYNLNLIDNNKNIIKNSFSIFLFRKDKNLDFDLLKQSIKEIKKINPNINIYIDQEWWLINRYKDFSSINYDFYLQNDYIYNKYKKLNSKDKKILENTFSNEYFPSMKNIYLSYKNISNKNKKNFLDIIAFIRLQNLSDIGINTHWLVLDLDNWNPVISWYDRSFSNNIDDYKILVDSYIWASKLTWTMLYAKHFPWHWEGDVDSHKNILVYDNNYNYLTKNIELFDYFLNNNKSKRWIMVGHMYLPNKIKKTFLNSINSADFILTDDLAMNWYKNSWSYNNDKMFFSTIELLKTNNIFIKVDTTNRFYI